MYYFLVPVAAFFLVFLFIFKDQDVRCIMKSDEANDNKSENLYSKIQNLKTEEIDFLYEISRQSLNESFALRDGENKTILSHATIFFAASTLFYFISRWSYRHHDESIIFLILVVLLIFAFSFLAVSIISVFRSFTVKYTLPPQAKDLANLSSEYSVQNLKTMLIDRWTECVATNYPSNKRKMDLLTLARKYLFFAFVVLVIAFIFIVCIKYIGCIAPSLGF